MIGRQLPNLSAYRRAYGICFLLDYKHGYIILTSSSSDDSSSSSPNKSAEDTWDWSLDFVTSFCEQKKWTPIWKQYQFTSLLQKNFELFTILQTFRGEKCHTKQHKTFLRIKTCFLSMVFTCFYMLLLLYPCHFHHLHPNINMHILHTVLYTFPKVLTRRICLTIKSFFSWWSFPLFLWPKWFRGNIVRRN